MRRPRVGIVMIAYNVVKYIGQAIDSVLAQEPDFDYELFVGDDCSTDGTRELVLKYAAACPDRIHVALRERNLGMNPNFFATWNEARGDFIALLDADDYWTSADKLRKQVDFLVSHPECSICFHNAMVVYEDGESPDHPFHLPEPSYHLSAPVPPRRSGLAQLVKGNFLQTGSVMYRGGLIPELPDWVFAMPTFDWPLHLLHAQSGDIGYIDEVLSAYRVHPGGFWSSNLSYYRTTGEVDSMIRAYGLIDRHLGGRYRAEMKAGLAYLYVRGMKLAASNGNGAAASRYAARFLDTLPYRDRIRERAAVKLWLKGKAPAVYRGISALRALLKRGSSVGEEKQ